MTVLELVETLQTLLKNEEISLSTEIRFRHNIYQHGSNFSEVNYVLTEQVPNSLVLCYDDGMW
jgi:hypothetical protein